MKLGGNSMAKVFSSNLGYPRIGEQREWKRELEKFWSGKISEKELLEETKAIRLEGLRKQKEKGIDLIPVGDFSLYDHVLDTSVTFGVIPKRFQEDDTRTQLETYFAIARGTHDAVASEMTKWFNTNYHYIVPEFNESKPSLKENRPLSFYKEAKEELGIEGKPVLLGPITFIKLGKGYEDKEFPSIVQEFLPLYIQVIKELKEAGVKWIQIDEPIFSTALTQEDLEQAEYVYETFAKEIPEINIIIQTYFESVDSYETIVNLPATAIGLDFVHGNSLDLLSKHGFPKDKILAAGVIDGRNVWRQNLNHQSGLLESIGNIVDKERIIVQASSSLIHVPVTTESEKTLDPVIKDALSFADEKLDEIALLAKGFGSGKEAILLEIEESVNAIEALNHSDYRKQTDANPAGSLNTDRKLPFKERISIQKEQLQLPLLPTTTIGSLPQTAEVRRERLKWRKGDITDQTYEEYIQSEIKKWIDIQEEIGLDVLVHGEFERTDMVEYFGEKLDGFLVTKFGWVQSYGSRCVRPPVIFGDVSFDKPMTVKESVYAQKLTKKKVKGMLTGPVTILNWSFVRDDISRFDVLDQIAAALRLEIEELEKNGIKIIQVDEPALREGLPLKVEKWNQYLQRAVNAFKLATASVQNSTQIHTHMCYSDFQDIFEAISALDADVISIETSRSHGELISTFEENTYDKEIGLGVYDIHSPRVPSKEEIKANVNRALQTIPVSQYWINPDCGLKTRQEAETIAALKNMVAAAKEIREVQLIGVQSK